MARHFVLSFVILFASLPSFAGGTPKSNPEQAIDRILANERALSATMRSYSPMVETYLQRMQPDASLGFVPSEDRYFLGRVLTGEEMSCVSCHRPHGARSCTCSRWEPKFLKML